MRGRIGKGVDGSVRCQGGKFRNSPQNFFVHERERYGISQIRSVQERRYTGVPKSLGGGER